MASGRDDILTFGFADIPLHRDIYLRLETDHDAYREDLSLRIEGREQRSGSLTVAFAAARGIAGAVMHLSWYPNIVDRFHEVRIRLPQSAFVTGIECPDLDEKPSLFVRDSWLNDLYQRSYSIFAMVDAIGVKQAIVSEQLSREKLIELQQRIDALAAAAPDALFVSFADNLLIKANWYPTQPKSSVAVFAPERMIQIIEDVQVIFRSVLDLDTYAIITQGSNEYQNLAHLSPSRNHVSLNSLGLPFAQLLAIDQAVRTALRAAMHEPAEIYMDKAFLQALSLPPGFDRDGTLRGSYKTPLTNEPERYAISSRSALLHAIAGNADWLARARTLPKKQ